MPGKIGIFKIHLVVTAAVTFILRASGRACTQTSIEYRSTAKALAEASLPSRTRNSSVTLAAVLSKGRAHSMCPVMTQFNPRGSHEQVV